MSWEVSSKLWKIFGIFPFEPCLHPELLSSMERLCPQECLEIYHLQISVRVPVWLNPVA